MSTKNLPEINIIRVKICFSFWGVYEMLDVSDESAAVVVNQILCRYNKGFTQGGSFMNGEGVVLVASELVFPINNTKNEEAETQIFETAQFETIQIESITVSEIKTENQGTRFARLKKILRKRSASIL